MDNQPDLDRDAGDRRTGTYARPVPTLGDLSSANERADDPRGWAFPAAERQALHQIMAARRDVRRFRPDPVPDDVFTRVLEAAHSAPSVGHSQPWRFVVITSAATRERAVLMADRARLAEAEAMDPESGRRLLDLQLDGIREAPIGIVVCCDRRTPAAGVLGRATFADTDLWSCACAIENLWLAARAEGLGLGWVTLFEPAELAELVGLPSGVETLGWLCLGWPDERPPSPGLERAGWSRRSPIEDVLLWERWPGPDGPVPPQSRIRAPGSHAVVASRDAADVLLTPPGSLGVLDRALDRVIALGHTSLDDGVLVLAGADHPVAGLDVSPYPATVTTEVMTAAVAGEAVGVVAARSSGMRVLIVDTGVGITPVVGAIAARVGGRRGDLVHCDAMTTDATRALLDAGREAGSHASGLIALGEVGVGNSTVAAALVVGLLDRPAADLVDVGAGADSAMVARKIHVVTSAVHRARTQHGSALRDPTTLLAALGGPEIAFLTGTVLGAANRGAVVILDGLATSIAALIATRIEPAVAAHLVAGHRSREIAHAAVLEQLGLEPLLDIRLRAGEGVGASLAVGLLRSGLQIRRTAARTEPKRL